MLGAALKEVVRDEGELQLHSFPSPNVKSGSFVHDISLGLKSWSPTKEELRAISGEMVKLASKKLPIERLEVYHDLALEMFKYDPYKREQLPSISRSGTFRKLPFNRYFLRKQFFALFQAPLYCTELVIMLTLAVVQ